MPVAFDSLWLWYLVLSGTVAVSAIMLWWVGVPVYHIRARFRDRFFLGVPWGTIITVLVLFAVYLGVQRGWWYWHRPVMVRYMAFSLFEPVGWLFAGLAHSSPGHLMSNLTSTIVFAPIVEYAWGHYPAKRGRRWEPGWLQSPLYRAFLIFPGVLTTVAVVSGLFSWGPVIGFSFVVFALIGCAMVYFPVLTLAALIVRSGVRVLYRTLLDPLTIAETSVRVIRPSWFGTAVQGHLFGLLLGVLVGIALLRYRERTVPLGRLWFASLFVGLSLSLWALWWVLGPEEFVVFRALGVGLVLLLATVVAVATTTDHTVRLPLIDRPAAHVAIGVIVLILALMAAVGFGLNLTTVESTDVEDAVEVDGYEIFYAEQVPDAMVNVVDVELLGLGTDVNTSGVIVQSEDRRVWYRTVSVLELETHGRERFTVGDLGWSQQVFVERTGWVPADNESVYTVSLHAGDGWKHAFDSDTKRAGPIVNNHQFLVAAEDGEFVVGVEHEGTKTWVDMPGTNESVEVANVVLYRDDTHVYVSNSNTQVRIASQETYE